MGRREAPRSRSRTSLWSTPLNSQSTTPKDLVHHSGSLRDEGEEARRVQLVEVTIDSLAEVGYVGTTLAEIARRAGVSPGLVAHYFDDKDGLLEADFRTLARTLAARMRARLALARTPRGRVQAVIDTNLAPEEFDQRTGTAWLAFWGQVLHVRGLKRVQTAYQRRMLSNLRSDLRRLIPGEEARSLASMIAAMIDGVWLRADRKSTRLNSSHVKISYAVFCLKKKTQQIANCGLPP